MKIKSINYNWFTSAENGEEFTNRTVGIKYGNIVCDKIVGHEGQSAHYYDVYYSDGTMQRVYNVNEVSFVEA